MRGVNPQVVYKLAVFEERVRHVRLPRPRDCIIQTEPLPDVCFNLVSAELLELKRRKQTWVQWRLFVPDASRRDEYRCRRVPEGKSLHSLHNLSAERGVEEFVKAVEDDQCATV